MTSAADRESPAASQRLWSQQWQFTLKELRETLRDRRTIITLLAMPLLMYPLLGLGMRFLAVQQLARESPEYRIAVETKEEAEWLKRVGARVVASVAVAATGCALLYFQ